MTRLVAPSYLAPYVRGVQQHGADSVEALLWASEQTQAARFETMRRIHPLSHKRLLDAGCGKADLLDHLLSRATRPAEFIGLEAVDEFADAAEAKGHADCTIVRADFVQEPQRMLVGAIVLQIIGTLIMRKIINVEY